MAVRNYNGSGSWSVEAVQARYDTYAHRLRPAERTDLAPREHQSGADRWIYPVMEHIIEGIEKGDPACAEIGVEFIEESASFPFGMSLKSRTARALRRAELTPEQKERIRRRAVEMLRTAYLPGEFREYAKLARAIGLGPWLHQLDRGMDLDNARVHHYHKYIKTHAADANRP
jgi:hypothetical protein